MALTKYAELRKGRLLWYYVIRNRKGTELDRSRRKYLLKIRAHRAALRAGYVVHG